MLNWIVWNRTDYLHKMDLALNNQQRLICHKTQPTKPSLYIYIKYIWFGWVGLGFYGLLTIVGYSMPNPLYTYILNIYDLVGFGFMAYQPL